jgi:hypothetical protein
VKEVDDVVHQFLRQVHLVWAGELDDLRREMEAARKFKVPPFRAAATFRKGRENSHHFRERPYVGKTKALTQDMKTQLGRIFEALHYLFYIVVRAWAYDNR